MEILQPSSYYSTLINADFFYETSRVSPAVNCINTIDDSALGDAKAFVDGG